MVDPRRGDVLEVVMADVGRELGDRAGQVLAHAEGVADVEVQADRRGVHPLGDFEVLVGRLEQQARLGLDQEQDAAASWACSASGLRTSTNRSIASCRDLARRERPARLGRDVRGTQLGAEAQGAPGVVDPDLAVVPRRAR